MNKQLHQQHERKYIGIVLEVNGFHYFAPLSSFKQKHLNMQERIDFIKIHNYSVININNMFPVPTETPLTRRCNDFLKLEKACINYQ